MMAKSKMETWMMEGEELEKLETAISEKDTRNGRIEAAARRMIGLGEDPLPLPRGKRKAKLAASARENGRRMLEQERESVLQRQRIALAMVQRRIPARDRDDVLQEVLVAYIMKDVQEEYMMYLIAKEKIVQYYRRGRIDGRNFRNLLLTRQYYIRVVHDEETTDGIVRRENIGYRSRWSDDPEEYAPLDLSDNGEGEQQCLDVALIASLPARIREIGQKRVDGIPLSASERKALQRFRESFELTAIR